MSSSKGQQQQQQHVPLYSLLGSSLVFHNFRQHEKKGGHSISRNRRRLQYKMEREIELVSLLKWLYTLVLLYNRCWLLYCLFLDPLLLQQEWRRRRRQRYYWNHKVSTPLFFIFFIVCIAQNVCGFFLLPSLSLSLVDCFPYNIKRWAEKSISSVSSISHIRIDASLIKWNALQGNVDNCSAGRRLFLFFYFCPIFF